MVILWQLHKHTSMMQLKNHETAANKVSELTIYSTVNIGGWMFGANACVLLFYWKADIIVCQYVLDN